MSKIIIHNNSAESDVAAIILVQSVMRKGFVSGENQYCWLSQYKTLGAIVHAKKTRGTTHTFEVRDL